MAELEAEVFLLGRWKNFEELEESISLPELDFILKHKREREHNEQKFAAALQGVDLDKDAKNSVEERLEKVQRAAAVRLAGGEEEFERLELQELGFGFQTL